MTLSLTNAAADRYLIIRPLGRGGSSMVYLARDRREHADVAIKVVSETNNIVGHAALAQLRCEAEALRLLSHPQVPGLVEFWEEEGRAFLVTELVPGKNLRELVRENGPVGEEKAAGWMSQVCDVLSYLHAQVPPVIYRDMKPSHLILDAAGTIHLVDFGSIGRKGKKEPGERRVFGTRGYAPPEQFLGRTDERSDIYAMGKTMGYLLTGKAVESEEIFTDSIRTSLQMKQILERCLRTNPDERFPTAAELKKALEGLF